MEEIQNPNNHLLLFFCFLACFILSDNHSCRMSQAQLLPIVGDDVQTYIVHVAKPEGVEFISDEDLNSWHKSFLPKTTLDSGEPRLVYSYRKAISGFAARLTPNELKAMESMDGFVYARPDEQRELQTTYTPKFLSVSTTGGAWSQTRLGEGNIIAVIDSGIHPTHPSFNDIGMPPPPLIWRQRCRYPGFFCNNKIIGAVAFRQGMNPSPIDDDGHGTHVASIAAGSSVDGASVLGMADGTAIGIAPKAFLAIYKVCFPGSGCRTSDVLAGIDQAISDGVNIISMSLSGGRTAKFYQDPIAIGSLSAVKRGISAVSVAGNSGPGETTVQHHAPWVLVVGATSTDRRVGAFVRLGNGQVLEGESSYQPSPLNPSLLPIVYPGQNGLDPAIYCKPGSLDHIDVTRKVVLCRVGGNVNDIDKGRVVAAAGGAAMILMNLPNQGYTTSSAAHVLPVSNVNSVNAGRLVAYFRSTSAPRAEIIFQGTSFSHRPSPSLASFSSRGPSLMNGGILKPDVLAPGVNILAAWPYDVGPNPSSLATKTFNFLSGTSMAAPHVSGIIALIKNNHAQWSPAAIQSAIVTSAIDRDLDGGIIVDEYTNNPAEIFAVGAGQVNALGALNPGLVYDFNPDDYIGYLCGLGYTDAEVTATVGRQIRCSTVAPISADQLNYPSISGSLAFQSRSRTFYRTVTNVGKANSIYQARITEPLGVRVVLSTGRLEFNAVGQTRSFTVQLTFPGSVQVPSYGKLEWVDNTNKLVVTSPIAVSFI